MNLADIRKKAGLVADKPSQQVGGVADGQGAGSTDVTRETLVPHSFSSDGLDDILDPCDESLPPVFPEDEPVDELAEASSSGGIPEEELPQDLHEPSCPEEWLEEQLPPLSIEPPSVSPEMQRDASAVVAVVPRASFAAYNPLAVLLAGRAAVEEVVEQEEAEEDLEVSSENLLEYLCFRVSDELYAVNIMEIKEIIKPREWTEVPRAPHFISGVISLRGVIIPVFDMRRRLGLPQVSASGRERIVVVRDGETFCGILVDEVVQVVRIPATSVEPAPTVLEGIDRDFVIGIGRHEGTMLILLSLENILNLSLV